MPLHKHLLHSAALTTVFVTVFAVVGDQANVAWITPVAAQSGSSEGISRSAISLQSVSFSAESLRSVPVSSLGNVSQSNTSFNFSQFSQNQSFSLAPFSRASASFSFSRISLPRFSQSSTSSAEASEGGNQSIPTFGGADDGTFGGLIGINGGTFGGGGFTTGTLGGGQAPEPSANPATRSDCDTTSKTRRNCIPLTAPLGTKNSITVSPGIGVFLDYFNEAVDLIMTVSVGFAVLWILIGSYFVMVSGSDGGKRSTGKSMITWAMIGLIIVNFAGFFLRTMNDIFFI